MAGIASYSGLVTAVSNWLLRTDLDDVVPQFIHQAEDSLRMDPRVRRLVVDDAFEVTGPSTTLPAEFKTLEGVALPESLGGAEIRIISPANLNRESRRFAPGTGPMYAAVTDTDLLVAPDPGEEPVELSLAYWETFPRLDAAGVLSNWLLAEHSDIYLYATLVESAPFIREDQRLQVWRMELEKRLEDFHRHTQRQHYSGSLVTRPARPIP